MYIHLCKHYSEVLVNAVFLTLDTSTKVTVKQISEWCNAKCGKQNVRAMGGGGVNIRKGEKNAKGKERSGESGEKNRLRVYILVFLVHVCVCVCLVCSNCVVFLKACSIQD